MNLLINKPTQDTDRGVNSRPNPGCSSKAQSTHKNRNNINSNNFGPGHSSGNGADGPNTTQAKHIPTSSYPRRSTRFQSAHARTSPTRPIKEMIPTNHQQQTPTTIRAPQDDQSWTIVTRSHTRRLKSQQASTLPDAYATNLHQLNTHTANIPPLNTQTVDPQVPNIFATPHTVDLQLSSPAFKGHTAAIHSPNKFIDLHSNELPQVGHPTVQHTSVQPAQLTDVLTTDLPTPNDNPNPNIITTAHL